MKIIAILLLLLLLLLSISAYFIFVLGCRRRKGAVPLPQATAARPQWPTAIAEGKNWFLSQNPLSVEILSQDELTLRAYYLDAGTSDTLILMHGYHAEGLYEFCPLLKFYYESGYNILLPDQRAHGRSEGKYLSFGIKERQDVADWCHFLNETHPPRNIFLSGISMGGATVVLSSTVPLPANVRGIIADCPFGDPGTQFRYSLSKRFPLPGGIFIYLAGFWSRLLADWHFTNVTLSDLEQSTLPLLLLHGTADPVVPHYMSEDIFEVYGGEKELLLFENCAHAYANLSEPERYRTAVLNFLNRNRR